MREVPRVLMAFERPAGGSTEGCMFVVSPDTGELVVQLVVAAPRLHPMFAIPGGDEIELAHRLLREYAPEEMEVLERSAHRARLSLVGGSGPEAA